MKTQPASQSTLPFGLGEPRSFAGLTIVPLYPEPDPVADYVGLDEAVAAGARYNRASPAAHELSKLVNLTNIDRT